VSRGLIGALVLGPLVWASRVRRDLVVLVMEGRWTIRWDPDFGLGAFRVGGTRPFPVDRVPVVPCDDAAVERAARVLIKSTPAWLLDYTARGDAAAARDIAEAVLRAAGEHE
jgi:hypothetical protein